MRVVETVPTHLAGQFSHHQSHQQNTSLTSLQSSSQSNSHAQTTIQQSSLDTTLTTTIGPFSPPEQPSIYIYIFQSLFWCQTLNNLQLALFPRTCCCSPKFTDNGQQLRGRPACHSIVAIQYTTHPQYQCAERTECC